MSDAQVPPPPPPTPSAAPPPAPAGQDSGNRTVMIILAYLGPLALIPFFVEERNQEIRWHAKHGLVLLVAEVILGIVLGILTMIPVVGCVVPFVAMLIMLGLLVLHIICMVKGINGQRLLIPGLSDFADRF